MSSGCCINFLLVWWPRQCSLIPTVGEDETSEITMLVHVVPGNDALADFLLFHPKVGREMREIISLMFLFLREWIPFMGLSPKHHLLRFQHILGDRAWSP